MKKTNKKTRMSAFVIALVMLISVFPALLCAVGAENGKEGYVPINYDDMKGIWLSQFDMASAYRHDEAGYRAIISKIADNFERDGFNTIIIQMRPYGDSFYPSEVYCPSDIVTTGYDGTFAYDPLAILLEIAHAKGISVHAWINPMRLMDAWSISAVPAKYRIAQWYKDPAKNGDYIVNAYGRYYLNPAYPETRQMVIDGAVEICENYDIDGIHMDDYFYISIQNETEDLAFDQKSYNFFGQTAYGIESRKAWRRENVNALVKGLYDAVKAVDERILFGVSPMGDIYTNYNGYLCADVYTWCGTPGYIDYIVPQLYQSYSEHYKARVEMWSEITCPEVRLIIGLGIYLAVDPPFGTVWYDEKDNIKKMIEYNKSFQPSIDRASCSGWVLFSYAYVYDVETGGYYPGTKAERENLLLLLKEKPALKAGDVNGDGKIDALDASLVLQHDAGLIILDAEAKTAADVNRDGKIDALDASLILQIDAGLIDNSSFIGT